MAMMKNTSSKSSKAMVYPLVPAEEWVKRYELFVSPRPCQNCGKILIPAIPFAYGRWRGLTSAPHGCEENFDVFVFTKATVAERQEWSKYFNTLKDHLL